MRAGVLEQGTADLLDAIGLGERMRKEGLVHNGINLRFAGERHHIDFRELTGRDYPSVTVSAETGAGLDAIPAFLFDHLGVVRVYTKIPGQPPDLSRPFTVRRGQTVEDVAALIHKDLVATLRWARLWRQEIEGLQVGKHHVVEDGDVLEIHTH